MTLDPNDDEWYIDSGATTHLTTNPGKISIPIVSSVKSVVAGNGEHVSVIRSCHTTLPHPFTPVHFKDILHTQHSIKNLVSVRKFCRDNNLSVKFDPYCFSLKYYKTGKHLMRHNRSSEFYPFTKPTNAQASSFFFCFFQYASLAF